MIRISQEKVPIKIAFFNKELPADAPNGVSCQVHRLANALVQRDHELTCFSCSRAPQDALYKTVQCPGSAPRSRLINKFRPALFFRSIATAGFDVLHYHGDDYLCAGSKKRVRTFYGSALFEALHAKKLSRAVYQALFYCFEWVSLLRRGKKVGISAHCKCALPCIRDIIPCGVPLDRFCAAPAHKTTFPSLLFLGDLDSRKQGRALLQVFTDVILPAYPSCQLTVVGPRRIALPGVRYCGRLSEAALIAEYQQAWILCMVSTYEGFGVPLIEAIACGTAVVALKNGTAEHLIEHGRDGLLCTIKTLGPSLLGLIADEPLRRACIQNGLQKVRRYDIKEIARQYERMYQTCITSPHARPGTDTPAL